MASNYVDITSIIQIIGSVYNNPQILDLEDKYTITEEDFTNDFHKIVFGSIFKLHELGAKEINLKNISDFLSNKPQSLGIYQNNNGEKWLLEASKNAISLSFDYYYNRMKKMTLLRAYDNCGLDVSDIYDPNNLFDTKLQEQQEAFLDNSSLEQIADIIDNKIKNIRLAYVSNNGNQAYEADEGIFDLIEELKQSPEVGLPLYGNLINTVTRGARLGKFYVRSAPTGVGNIRINFAVLD